MFLKKSGFELYSRWVPLVASLDEKWSFNFFSLHHRIHASVRVCDVYFPGAPHTRESDSRT